MKSRKLNETFRITKIDVSRLSSNREFLRSMGLNPEFEKKCLAIFTEIGATSDEVMKISNVIEEQNGFVTKGIVGLETKRDGLSYKEMINGASDDYFSEDKQIV